MSVDKTELVERRAEGATHAAKISDALLQQIISGALPPGHRLDENMLAEQFAVSRTPVREALRELAARKLIELVPRRGGVVTQIGMEALADMLDAECELEGLCARLAAQRMNGLQKGQLEHVHEQTRDLIARRGTDVEFYELNGSFHDLILSGSHNRTLDAAARELRFRLSPYRRTGPESDKDRLMERILGEHTAIVNAILSEKPEQAYEAMRTHNARVNAKALRHFRKQLTQ